MEVLKQLILLVLIIAVGLGVYFGALLPLGKAQSFINAQTNLSTVQNTDDLKKLYDVPLTMWSPVGQEEAVKFTAGTLSDILMGQNIDEQTARWLVEYIEPHLFKNDLRHLLLLGDMYRVIWERYGGNPQDFIKAEEYYLKANAIGPKIPPILYRLTDMYLKTGNKDEARKHAETILKYWDDENVRQVMSQL